MLVCVFVIVEGLAQSGESVVCVNTLLNVRVAEAVKVHPKGKFGLCFVRPYFICMQIILALFHDIKY